MTDVKTDYLEALNTLFTDADVMAKIQEYTFPDLSDVPIGTDLITSAVSLSVYCHNANKILQAFSGLPLLQYLLMGCAFSPVFQSINLSGLSIAKEPNPHAFVVNQPAEGAAYTGPAVVFSIIITDGADSVTAVMVILNDSLTYLLERDAKDKQSYWVVKDVAAGSYVAQFNVKFRIDNGAYFIAHQTVNFTVV